MLDKNECKNVGMTEETMWFQEWHYVNTNTCTSTQKHTEQNYTRGLLQRFLSGFENMQGNGIFVRVVLQPLLREEFITLI